MIEQLEKLREYFFHLMLIFHNFLYHSVIPSILTSSSPIIFITIIFGGQVIDSLAFDIVNLWHICFGQCVSITETLLPFIWIMKFPTLPFKHICKILY